MPSSETTRSLSTYRVPYGQTALEFTLPPGVEADVVLSHPMQPLADVSTALAETLAHPIGSPPLRKLCRAGQRACIVFTDITRASPDHLLVPALLRELSAAGVRDEDVTLLCGVGMHRASTHAEKVAKLGHEIATRYRVIDNEPQNLAMLVDLGTTPGGVPVQAHRAAVEADILIATGIVEPHQYAGYSGGRKTVAVGAAGETDRIRTGRRSSTTPHRLGRIEGNPFHGAVAAARRGPA
jgi:nickel-dependent lactate racemase